jgi:hypothetical protein
LTTTLTSTLGGGAAGKTSPLAPVTGIVAGLTGGTANSGSTNTNPLAPVTNLVGGLLGGLGGAAANK